MAVFMSSEVALPPDHSLIQLYNDCQQMVIDYNRACNSEMYELLIDLILVTKSQWISLSCTKATGIKLHKLIETLRQVLNLPITMLSTRLLYSATFLHSNSYYTVVASLVKQYTDETILLAMTRQTPHVL